MASEPVQRDSYRQYVYNTVLVKRTRLQVRNEEKRMWRLLAKRDIRAGEFIGMYTGSLNPFHTHSWKIGQQQKKPDQDQVTKFYLDSLAQSR